MTEMLFYHLQRQPLERVLPPLLEKSLERGWRVIVQTETDERVDALTPICGLSGRRIPGARHLSGERGRAAARAADSARSQSNGANIRFLIDRRAGAGGCRKLSARRAAVRRRGRCGGRGRAARAGAKPRHRLRGDYGSATKTAAGKRRPERLKTPDACSQRYFDPRRGPPVARRSPRAIPAGARVGLVGRNGIGKTTLFRAITASLRSSHGSFDLPARARIGRLAQEAPGGPESLIESCSPLHRAAPICSPRAETAHDPHRIAEIQTRLPTSARTRLRRALRDSRRLGSTRKRSGGRVATSPAAGACASARRGAVLRARPAAARRADQLSRLEGTLWLTDHLAHYPRSVIVISHDRDLLRMRSTGSCISMAGKLTRSSRSALTPFARRLDATPAAPLLQWVDAGSLKAKEPPKSELSAIEMQKNDPVDRSSSRSGHG